MGPWSVGAVYYGLTTPPPLDDVTCVILLQVVSFCECLQCAQRTTDRRSGISEHYIGDPGIRFNKATNALPGIHQLLKTLRNLTVINSYRQLAGTDRHQGLNCVILAPWKSG